MPLHRCTMPDGSQGWQWGQSGKKYKSKQDAIKQMKAIFASGYKEPVHKKACLWKYGSLKNSCDAFIFDNITLMCRGLYKIAAQPVRIPLKANPQQKPVYVPPAYLNYDSLKKYKPNTPQWLRQHVRIARANNRTRLVRAIIQQESKGNPLAVGPTNDRGLGQITPKGLAQLQRLGYIDKSVTIDDFLYDPDMAIKAINWTLDQLQKRHPGINPSKLYAMYNLGQGKFKQMYSGPTAGGYRDFKNVKLFRKAYDAQAANMGEIPALPYNQANYTMKKIPWGKGQTFRGYYNANPIMFYGIPYNVAQRNFIQDNDNLDINKLKAGYQYNIRGLH